MPDFALYLQLYPHGFVLLHHCPPCDALDRIKVLRALQSSSTLASTSCDAFFPRNRLSTVSGFAVLKLPLRPDGASP